MKKLLAGVVALLLSLSVVSIFSKKKFTNVGSNGYMIESSVEVKKRMNSNTPLPFDLLEVNESDLVYKDMRGFYVGDDRIEIDIAYPLYVEDGTTLRFIDDQNYLITNHCDVYTTFDGLYESNGHTFNDDYSLADVEEFILIYLSNGLYINTQYTKFNTAFGETIIPMNSIIQFTNTDIRWYRFYNGSMGFGQIDIVFDGHITIGENEYTYTKLLDSLGLLIKHIEDPDEPYTPTDPLGPGGEDDPSDPGTGGGGGGGGDPGDNPGGEPGENPGDPGTGGDPSHGDDPGTGGGGDPGTGTDDPGTGGDDDPTSGGGDTPGGGDPGGGGDSPSSGGGDPSDDPGGSGSGQGQGGEEHGGHGEGKHDPRVEDYRDPVVTLKDIEIWCYAVNLKLVKNDPLHSITRSISLTAYKNIKETKKVDPTYVNEEGFTMYPSSSFVGKSTALRKGVSNSSEFALSVLEPGSTIYLQVTYRYDQPVYSENITGYTESGEPIYSIEYVRHSYSSDLMEITLKNIEDCDISSVAAEYSLGYASKSDGFVLNNFEFSNTSDYDANTEEYSFENFKKNTIQFINSLELKLTPEGSSNTITSYISQSYLRKANDTEGGIEFNSTSPKLDSNTKYNFIIFARDRWGHHIPLTINGGLDNNGVIYTSKSKPSTTIKEGTNTIEKYETTVTIKDEDKAFDTGSDVYFEIVDKKTQVPIELEGTFSENVIVLEDNKKLKLITDGSEAMVYNFSLTSLAYSHLYEIHIVGEYDVTPDLGPEQLEIVTGTIGSATCYTAALNSGQILFDSKSLDLADTSVTLSFQMLPETTMFILPLISEYHVAVYKVLGQGEKELIDDQTITRQMLQKDSPYEAKSASFIIAEGNDTTPRIAAYGLAEDFYNSVWDSFNIREFPAHIDEETGDEIPTKYSNPLQLRVVYPKKFFTNDTDYSYEITAKVIKSGEPYSIPVSMTGNSFITKKTRPEIKIDEIFLAGSVAQLSGVSIYDPDGVILAPNQVNIYLSYKGVRLDYRVIDTTKDINANGINISFENLIKGELYTIQFRAPQYNDARGTSGFTHDYNLKDLDFYAGSGLSGNLTFDNVDYDANTVQVGIDFEDQEGYLFREGEESKIYLKVERSLSMEIKDYEVIDNIEFDLERNEDPETMDTIYSTFHLDYIRDNISHNDAYRYTLSATYLGVSFDFCVIEFNTNHDYVIVKNQREMLDAMKADKYANILVSEDFNHEINEEVSSFAGTIDFLGHTVTRTENTITKHFIYSDNSGYNRATISNLIYAFPKTPEYELQSAPFYNYPNIDNLVIKTSGQVTIKTAINLIGQVNKLDTFQIELGGDLVYDNESENSAEIGFVASTTYGSVIRNGLIYANRNYGIVIRNHIGNASLFHTHSEPTIENILIVCDTWYQISTGALLDTNYYSKVNKNVRDVVYVGEFYTVGDGEPKTTFSPDLKVRFTYGGNASGYSNVWALNSGKNTYTNVDSCSQSRIEKLLDIEWLDNTLGDAFEVKKSINLGFYPRLMFSDIMSKNQQYISLPTLSISTDPYIIEDVLYSGNEYGSQTFETAIVRIKMTNSVYAEVKSIEFDYLDCTILDQYFSNTEQGDSTYNVICKVTINEDNPNYVSTYRIKKLEYQTPNGVTNILEPSYATKSIEMWKEIATVADWTAINSKMAWNYKITRNLDFDKKSPVETIINGSTINYTSTSTFTGKIDGQEHILSNISITEITNPYLIYRISSSNIKNIFFDNIKIISGMYSNSAYSGIIGYATGSYIENIRVKNGEFGLQGRAGVIVGETYSTIIDGASVVNSEIYDVNTGKILILGGIVGYISSYSTVRNCYVREININVYKTTVVNEVGGIVGYAYYYNTIKDCYSYGFIRTNYTNVGGIVGNFNNYYTCNISGIISYIEILQTNGRYAGGISSNAPTNMKSVITLGKISSTGMANKLIGNSTTNRVNCYSFDEQLCSGHDEDKGDSDEAFSSLELTSAELWKDTIRLGTGWDYSSLDDYCFPLIAKDTENEEFKQQTISLPGYTDDPIMQIINAQYVETETYKYTAEVLLTHPRYSTSELIDTFALTLEGMDISDMAIELGDAIVDVQEGNEPNTTIFILKTKNHINCTDTYRFIVDYTQPNGKVRSSTCIIQYYNIDGTPLFNSWDVHNINEWNTFASTHGTTNENVNIYGTIDFGKATTPFFNLTIGSMNGYNNAKFKGLYFDGLYDGDPWIKSINKELNNITFDDFDFDYSKTATVRTLTSPINSVVGDINNITVTNFVMDLNNYTRGYNGFIGRVTFPIYTAHIENVTIIDNKASVTSQKGSYAGGLVGYTTNKIENATAINIKVSTGYTDYVGGIAGYAPSLTNPSITDFEVKGKNYVGGIAGETDSISNGKAYGTDDKLKINVSSTGDYIGGLVGINGTTISNTEIENVVVQTSSSYAGLICGRGESINYSNVKVLNCNITGKGYVGGASGRSLYSSTFKNVQVVDCNIANNDSANSDLSVSGTGGLLGYADNNTYYKTTVDGAVIRNTSISGSMNVGGLVGYNSATIKGTKINKAYIAEDVTISSKSKNVGGIFGYTGYATVSNNIVGANVSSSGPNVGGLVGYCKDFNVPSVILENNIFAGTAKGIDYVGGLIGLFDARFTKYTKTDLVNCLVSGEVICNNSNISFWINDASPNGDAGSGSCYIYENALINGQAAKTFRDAYRKLNLNESITPRLLTQLQEEIDLLVTYDELISKTLYTSKLSFSTNYWSFDHLNNSNTYYPYTLNNAKTGILDYVKKGYDNTTKGIKFSTAPENAEFVVYTSGVNTINIETKEPNTNVTVNGKTINTGEKGIITLYYDFKTNLTVNGKSYSADTFARKVMTNSYGSTSYYYYLDSAGKVHYGLASGSNNNEVGVIDSYGTIIHLYEGYAMNNNGQIYVLPENRLHNKQAVTSTNNLTAASELNPIMKNESISSYYFRSYVTNMFGNETLVNGIVMPKGNDSFFVFSYNQGILPDGIIYGMNSSTFSPYVITLNANTHKLSCFLSNLKLDDVKDEEIKYMTNTYNYSGDIALFYTVDNRVIGINYINGNLLFSK